MCKAGADNLSHLVKDLSTPQNYSYPFLENSVPTLASHTMLTFPFFALGDVNSLAAFSPRVTALGSFLQTHRT